MKRDEILKNIDNEIFRISEELHSSPAGSEEYQSRLKEMETLISLRGRLEDPFALKKALSNQALLNFIGTIVMGWSVLNHEKLNVITSRAWGFVRFR